MGATITIEQKENYDGVKPIYDTPKLFLRVIYRTPVITDNKQARRHLQYLRREVVARFIDIVGTTYHHCLDFLCMHYFFRLVNTLDKSYPDIL